jgi:hypothetical protein
MKFPSEPLPDDEPPPGRKEFMAQMKDDHGFAETMRRLGEEGTGRLGEGEIFASTSWRGYEGTV